ncbi:hypothetical protein B0H13DRAFT_1856189 [Mycena leptocephala]|nr:hypothetical protein B0H13DRAFT_1856189 [Mycena leptocephala]
MTMKIRRTQRRRSSPRIIQLIRLEADIQNAGYVQWSLLAFAHVRIAFRTPKSALKPPLVTWPQIRGSLYAGGLSIFQLKERQQIVPYLEPTRGKTFVLFPPFWYDGDGPIGEVEVSRT